jgi:CheY-like chemotaxis protein/pSer/pThr/pTyr-binding forkhead associated (FHA) protein
MSDKNITSWVIELSAEGMTEPLKVQLDDRLIIGRKDKTGTAEFPDIDLGPYGADELGVSRHHLAIHTKDDKLLVTDLNSGNGTFKSEERLAPDVPHEITHEDVLTLGRMPLKFGIVISPTHGSLVHTQQSIQLEGEVYAGKGQLVLIVEDDPAVAKLLSLIMERDGYKTAVCRDVIRAMRIFNQSQPSAIILDIMLPGMEGLEFCRYVRRDARRNAIPIIVVSATKTEEKVKQAMQAGADIFLRKPLSAKEFSHVVSSLIRNYEVGVSDLHTKHLVGTAPLKSVRPESRRTSAVLFVAGYNEVPITVDLRKPVSFGRSANVKDRTHIDLTRFKAVDMGVSRVHMFLHHRAHRFFVEDNGSVNGTFVNGEPIEPHDPVPLYNGDEIRLGQLRTYIYFLADPNEQAQTE